MKTVKNLKIAISTGMMLLAVMFFSSTGLAAGQENDDAANLQSPMLVEEWQGDFEGMVKRRRIRVLVVPSKTYFFIDRGVQRGITHDIMREFETFINEELKTKILKVSVVFIPVRRDQLIDKLVEGYGDIAAANLTITPQRLKSVDFSDPFAKDIKEVVVTRADVAPMKSYDELEGREVYVRQSSSYYESLLQINSLFKKTGRKPIELVKADEALEDEDLLEMLHAGLISTVVMDSHKAEFWAKIFDNIRVHSDAYVRFDGEIAWAFRQNSPQLKKVVNEFVEKHKKGTLIGNMLLNRYFKNLDYVKNSVSEGEMKKFQAMVELFKTYAGQYGFDYLLLGAQAYQESGLDQSKKSPVGAIGVMQVLPSTAKDPNVGIPDIHVLEKNIHAGVKYLRFISDRYFSDGTIDPLNRVLFSFASYNAGPAKIQKVRERAKKMGLDHNIWFQNVEIAAAEIIGRETVQYVSNIYKYYIAYTMAVEQMEVRRSKKEQAGG
ncbi:MAG: lytic transglycosylase F [Desulfopila sp.]|jgi:membrane-bound lytic murein transglycosylase MltF|nr:lytic transglycosylase F [Desulfopila sp.]